MTVSGSAFGCPKRELQFLTPENGRHGFGDGSTEIEYLPTVEEYATLENAI